MKGFAHTQLVYTNEGSHLKEREEGGREGEKDDGGKRERRQTRRGRKVTVSPCPSWLLFSKISMSRPKDTS
jgi:hypothetical protein